MASTKPTAAAGQRNIGEHDPIAVNEIRESAPWWPYGTDGSYRLIRAGSLRAIAIGRRRYVTLALLRECLARHTVGVAA